MELLRVSKAAKGLGAHPMALRQWAVDGKIPPAGTGLCAGVRDAV
ncbi:hypothetical protein [Streptomyces roseoverticillatus]|nr:hypothetical protein [Streptomyces roseoverticillatus]